eukprot:2326923-Lingulodinium_polyedra.AAC.1
MPATARPKSTAKSGQPQSNARHSIARISAGGATVRLTGGSSCSQRRSTAQPGERKEPSSGLCCLTARSACRRM